MEGWFMFKRMGYRLLAVAICMLVFVPIAAAHEVHITGPAKVGNNPELQPGTYRVEVVKNQDSSEVLFYKEGDLWLRAPVTLVPETNKAQYTEVHYAELNDGKVITRIRLQGSKESLVFNQAPSTTAE
jgi:hypothetical protein